MHEKRIRALMDYLRAKIISAAIAGILVAAMAVWAQGYIITVKDSGFEKRRRPVVSFKHDKHNKTAGIESCSTCHHVYENGEKLSGRTSIGKQCSSCHLPEENGRLELIRAYHLQCKGCHLEKSKGPIQCAQCHRKKTSNEK
ncbi:MAG: cytochrome c3 family protein [Desulfobacterales bacterium]|nr:cytochrome c3 family protein [Desulfobacterales bacterium]